MTPTVEWFGDIRAELEPNDDRPGVSCFLYYEDDTGKYSGSLALCEDMGGIPYEAGTGPDGGDEVWWLSEGTLAEIRDWAVDNGY